MSSFGALADRRAHDAVRRAGRGVGQVPRRRRRAWASSIARRRIARAMRGQFATRWRSTCTTSGSTWRRPTQWRFTPPTHVRRRAATRRSSSSSPRAASAARGARYRDNCAALIEGMTRARLPAASCPRRSRRRSSSPSTRRAIRATTSRSSTTACASKGFILYPGKLTQVDTFRVGCIGAIDEHAVRAALHRDRRHRRRAEHPAA